MATFDMSHQVCGDCDIILMLCYLRGQYAKIRTTTILGKRRTRVESRVGVQMRTMSDCRWR
eukprot:7906681-Prorocentrum_lima.AAC.1